MERKGIDYTSDTQQTSLEGTKWESNVLAATSDSHLEDDPGEGDAAIIRMFEFGINPEEWAKHHPTNQELFNSHAKGIEIMLWRDGMKPIPEVNPRVKIGKKKYRIFVGAKPMKGHILQERPTTLKQVVHGKGKS